MPVLGSRARHVQAGDRIATALGQLELAVTRAFITSICHRAVAIGARRRVLLIVQDAADEHVKTTSITGSSVISCVWPYGIQQPNAAKFSGSSGVEAMSANSVKGRVSASATTTPRTNTRVAAMLARCAACARGFSTAAHTP